MNKIRKEELNKKLNELKFSENEISYFPITQEEKEQLNKLKSSQDQRDFLKKMFESRTDDEKKDIRLLSSKVQNSYKSRSVKFYDLRQMPMPQEKYIKICIDMGDSDEKKIFLKTTYCYGPDGQEIALKKYIKKYRLILKMHRGTIKRVIAKYEAIQCNEQRKTNNGK